MKSGSKAGNHARDAGAAILLVDDNTLVATALARYLGVWGYEVTVASSVVDAGEILRDGRRRFDVVILDPLFPREHGEDLLKDIPRELPVVIFSANPERVTKGGRLRACAVVRKVARPGPLRIEVDRACRIERQAGAPAPDETADPVESTDVSCGVALFADVNGLSSREARVLNLLDRDLTLKEIGVRLNMAYPTVVTHLQRAAKKLGITGTGRRALLAAFADVVRDE